MPRVIKGVFFGYSSTKKAYRVFNKSNLCDEESKHVIYDEYDDQKKD